MRARASGAARATGWCRRPPRVSGAGRRSRERKPGSDASSPAYPPSPGASRWRPRRDRGVGSPIRGRGRPGHAWPGHTRAAPWYSPCSNSRSSRGRRCAYIPPEVTATIRPSGRGRQAGPQPAEEHERPDHHRGQAHLDAVGRQPAGSGTSPRRYRRGRRSAAPAARTSSAAARTDLEGGHVGDHRLDRRGALGDQLDPSALRGGRDRGRPGRARRPSARTTRRLTARVRRSRR